MVIFDGVAIVGTHGSPVFVAPALMRATAEYAGVLGESELTLGRKARGILIHIKLHDKHATYTALFNFIKTLDKMVGKHGVLRIATGIYGGLARDYKNVTFEGFSKDPTDDAGPLPDNVGTLDGAKPSWWVDGTLAFRQLSVEDD